MVGGAQDGIGCAGYGLRGKEEEVYTGTHSLDTRVHPKGAVQKLWRVICAAGEPGTSERKSTYPPSQSELTDLTATAAAMANFSTQPTSPARTTQTALLGRRSRLLLRLSRLSRLSGEASKQPGTRVRWRVRRRRADSNALRLRGLTITSNRPAESTFVVWAGGVQSR